MDTLEAFLERSLALGDEFGAAVAVGCEGDLGAALLQRVVHTVEMAAANADSPIEWRRRVHIVPVQPWGKFVNGLNALAQCALSEGYEQVLYQSAETVIEKQGVEALRRHLTPRDLVVGAAFPDHDFQPGKQHALDGRTTPWNTLALWHTRKLVLTGFIAVADGVAVPERKVALQLTMPPLPPTPSCTTAVLATFPYRPLNFTFL